MECKEYNAKCEATPTLIFILN